MTGVWLVRWEYRKVVIDTVRGGGFSRFLGGADHVEFPVVIDGETIIADLGNEGWELISVAATPDGKLHHYLKRPESSSQK